MMAGSREVEERKNQKFHGFTRGGVLPVPDEAELLL